jgi:hypothetical protein
MAHPPAGFYFLCVLELIINIWPPLVLYFFKWPATYMSSPLDPSSIHFLSNFHSEFNPIAVLIYHPYWNECQVEAVSYLQLSCQESQCMAKCSVFYTWLSEWPLVWINTLFRSVGTGENRKRKLRKQTAKVLGTGLLLSLPISRSVNRMPFTDECLRFWMQ